MKSKRGLILLISVVVLAVATLTSVLLQRGFTVSDEERFPIFINEIMASNSRYINADGACCDWIELNNASKYDFNIGGYKLTDKASEIRYIVPQGTIIPAGAYYVIYCLRGSQSSEYADLGISQNGGETIYLMNKRNVKLDTVITLSLNDNESMARQADGAFIVSMTATPGFSNDEEGLAAYNRQTERASGPVRINEECAANKLWRNSDGRLCDYIELYNGSDSDVHLAGYALSDRREEIRFIFPEGSVITAQGYLTVYCSSEYSGEYYANFALSRNGGEELLLLSSKGHAILDSFATISCGKNRSMQRDEHGQVVQSLYATPGHENGAESFSRMASELFGTVPIYISELMSDNTAYPDSRGNLYDWVEICNSGNETIKLEGWSISDSLSGNRYYFPEGSVIAANSYTTVYCKGVAESDDCAPFGLDSKRAETVFLFAPDGAVSDCVTTFTVPANMSLQRAANGELIKAVLASPGFPNDEAGAKLYAESRGANSIFVYISECMADNGAILPDSYGQFSDWIELYNAGSSSVSLSLLYLSDSPDDPYRFKLPDGILQAGERIVVFCSVRSEGMGDEIHAPFALSRSGDTVYLHTAFGQRLSAIELGASEQNRSFTYDEESNSYVVSEYPSPGYTNDTEGYKAFLADRKPITSLCINEVMPSNNTFYKQYRQQFFLYFDWVELKNVSGAPLNLNDYCLSNLVNEPELYRMPDVVLAPNDTYIIFCSGIPEYTKGSAYHANFRINATEDNLYIFDTNGVLVDYMRVFDVPTEGSIGRANGEWGVSLFENPTPNKENGQGFVYGIPSAMPSATVPEGVYDDTESLSVELIGDGEIFYSLDCSEPTRSSKRYSEPIVVTKTTVIRAVQYENGSDASAVLTLSYIMNEGHELPIVSTVVDPYDMFDDEYGIYANPDKAWKRDAHVSFFEENGSFSRDCGVKITGQTSRVRPNKSMRLMFTKYGGKLEYEMYKGYKVKSFSGINLRISLDSKYGVIREAFFTGLALPYKDTLPAQNSRFAVSYVNGEYYGLCCIMEVFSEEFYADYFDVDPDSVTIVKNMLYSEGKLEMYYLLEFCRNNDLSIEENYRYITENIDINSVIDWTIFQTYVNNTDISGNIIYIRCSERVDKWQFAIYDPECGMKLSSGNDASFDLVLKQGQTADIINALLRNEEFTDTFLKRLAYHCKNTFTREKVIEQIEYWDGQVNSEIERSFTRWSNSPKTYVYNVNQLRHLVRDYDRCKQLTDSISQLLELSKEQRQFYFGELYDG